MYVQYVIGLQYVTHIVQCSTRMSHLTYIAGKNVCILSYRLINSTQTFSIHFIITPLASVLLSIVEVVSALSRSLNKSTTVLCILPF